MPETHQISVGWEDHGPDSVPRAKLAGKLIELAADVVKDFHSDLYRDLLQVSRADDITGDWFYVIRTCGTHLARTYDDFTRGTYESNMGNAYVYHLTVTHGRHDSYNAMITLHRKPIK